ncbi:unnamed protein product [Hermetia illucens]|uniref:Chitin-binding type-2 domain-containing protein n=1 Tax=Hermetia illucens TaxID=343691 RepID=A0A7R8UIA7_HERIL|nr:uncharacterized protein LOC119648644 [Hermetia illucens]CAD7080542.1 unnamed protein product [Hermetia illucens]
MRSGITLGLLISALGILHNCKANRGYAGDCSNDQKLYDLYQEEDDIPLNQYRVCFSKIGEPKIFLCPENLEFNELTKSCAVNLGDAAIGTCTSEDDKFEDPSTAGCKGYYECSSVGGTPTPTDDPCEDIFHPLLQKCVTLDEYYCDEKPDCDDSHYQNRNWTDKGSCESYYECLGDIRVKEKCPSGMYFDPITQACLHNKNNCKVPEPTAGLLVDLKTMCKGNVGKFLPDPYYCKSYYYCLDEATPYWSPCDDDKYFANGSCTSVRPDSCTCEDVDWEGKTSAKVPHSDKSKYYVCKPGELPVEKTCPSGTIYDPEEEECLRN